MTTITDDLPARLLREEHEGWRALQEGRGGEHYYRSMTTDAVLIVQGDVIDRDRVLASFEGSSWQGYELHEPRVVRLGEKAAVLAYRAVAKRGEESVELRMTTTYLWQDGGWKVALHQQTPV